MPARDAYHDVVKNALIKDGWRITHDPYRLSWVRRAMFVDLGAEIIAAESGERRIAVEIKSFFGPSEVGQLEQALGQFVLYKTLLERYEPERSLYLALPETTLTSLTEDGLAQLLMEQQDLRMFGFNPEQEEVTRWLPRPF